MNSADFQKELDKRQQEKQKQTDKQTQVSAINKAGIKNVEATNRNTESTARGLKEVRGKVEVTNNNELAKSKDMNNVMDSIRDLNLTTFMSNTGYAAMAQNIAEVHNSLQALQKQYQEQGLPDAAKGLGTVVDKMTQLVKGLTGAKVSMDTNLQKTLDSLTKSIKAIEFNPQVNVSAPQPKIVTTSIDVSAVVDSIERLRASYDQLSSKKQPKVDFSPIVEGLQAVQDAISSQRFPVPNYVLPFKDSTGKAAQVQLDSSGNLPISASISGADGAVLDGANSSIRATVKNLSNSNPQAVAIVDSSGTQISSFGGGTQYTQGGATVADPTGTAEIWFDASGNPKGVTPSQPLPSNITNGTNIADVVAGDSGFNGVATTSGTKTYTFTTSTSGAQVLLPATLIEGYSWIQLQYSSVGSGLAATLQFCNTSGGTYVNGQTFSNNTAGVPSANSGVTNNIIYVSATYGNYVQLNITALTSGTVTGTIVLSNIPKYATLTAGQNGTWNVGSSSATGSAVPANAWYIAANNGGNLAGLNTTISDANGGSGSLSTALAIYNGTSYDRQRSANAASNTTGTGLLGTGILGYDGTDWQVAGIADANSATTGINGASLLTSGTGYTTATLTLNSSTPNTSWYDMLNYAWVSVEILTNTTPATLTFQTSGDSAQTNIRLTSLIDSQSLSGALTSTTTSTVATYHGPRTGRYFRINSNNGAGTTTLVLTFFTSVSQLPGFPINGSVGSNSATGSAVPANAFYMGIDNSAGSLAGLRSIKAVGDGTGGDVTLDVGVSIYDGTNFDMMRSATTAAGTTGTGLLGAGALGIYNSSAPTPSSGQYQQLQLDSSANLKVNLQTALPAGTNSIGQVATYINGGAVSLNTYELLSTTNATTTPTSTTCYVSSITITVDTAGTTSTITIADKSGTPVTLVNGLSTATAFLAPTIYNFQTPIKMTSGFTIVTAGAVAATVSIWVNYYA